MASCSRCGALFFSRGIKIGNRRFCSEACAARGKAIAVADTIPVEEVHELALEFFNGECPRCHRIGKGVDVRRHHRLLSAFVYVEYGTGQSVCCRSCGAKDQLGSLCFTLALGWWSRRGLLQTPYWIGKNVIELAKTAKRSPSSELRTILAQEEAKRLIALETIKSPYVRHPGI